MGDTKPAPLTLGPAEGEKLSIAGGSYRILVSGKDTGGAFATIEMRVPPNSGPGPHSHAGFYESFYVLEGEVEVKSEASTFIATQGAYVVIPKGGIIHKFKNITGKEACLLCTVVPSGLEEMFRDVSVAAAAEYAISPPQNDPEYLKQMIAIANKHGNAVYPPGYLD